MSSLLRWRLVTILALAGVACAVDRQRSPVCGMALLVGPGLIQQQLESARGLLTDVPRGLPPSLPTRLAGSADTARVRVTSEPARLVLDLEGARLPALSVDSTGRDSTVFGLLLVDDSTAVVQGVLIYDRPRPPAEYPRLGALVSADQSVPLYGLRVNWAAVSNPRCPLLGSADST